MVGSENIIKPAADLVSIGTIIAAFVDMLPRVAALLSVVWMAIRIWETKTVQGLVAKIKKALKRKR